MYASDSEEKHFVCYTGEHAYKYSRIKVIGRQDFWGLIPDQIHRVPRAHVYSQHRLLNLSYEIALNQKHCKFFVVPIHTGANVRQDRYPANPAI